MRRTLAATLARLASPASATPEQAAAIMAATNMDFFKYILLLT
jgi:hypothetical protein